MCQECGKTVKSPVEKRSIFQFAPKFRGSDRPHSPRLQATSPKLEPREAKADKACVGAAQEERARHKCFVLFLKSTNGPFNLRGNMICSDDSKECRSQAKTRVS